MKDICFFITILKRDDAQEFTDFYRRYGVQVIYSANCRGTARQKTLDLLGIEKTDKVMLLSMLSGELTKRLINRLEYEMHIDAPDRGIAVAVPVSSIGGSKTFEHFLSEQAITEKEENKMESGHELIIAITENDCTETVMDAARSAGAAGGTVVHAKGTLAGEAKKFFGVSIAEEKELIFIVSKSEQKNCIMKAIMKQAGIDSKAHTLVFSLPVTETAGFRFEE